MVDDFQVKLSSKEILIIAALLGYESVFGVDEKAFTDANVDTKSLIRQHVRKMERKKLIRYDLDGILYIVPGLRQAIDCICNAETVGMFSTNLKSGKKASVYIMEKEGIVTFLEYFGDGKYLIRIADTVPLKEIIPYEILSSQPCDIREMMLFEEAEYVHKQIEEFNHDEAEMRIKKHIKDETATKTIAKILTGNCGYMSVQIHRKGNNLYNAIYNSLLVAVNNCTISLVADENDVLCFEALSPVVIEEQINLQFNLSKERGAV